jgi:hypothetical protein
MPRPRRLVIMDAAGQELRRGGMLLRIDLTGIPNANSQIPLRVVLEELCDMEHWHTRNTGSELPMWSDLDAGLRAYHGAA